MITMTPIMDDLVPILNNQFKKWAEGRTGWMFGYRVHPILKCQTCKGTGTFKGLVCPTCKGSGKFFQFHNGLDLGWGEGTVIKSPWDGSVLDAWNDLDRTCQVCGGDGKEGDHPCSNCKGTGKDPINGFALRLRHEPEQTGGVVETAYCHLNGYGPGIIDGVKVLAGQDIAILGNTGRSTGPHLHFITRNIVNGKLNEIDPLPFLAASVGFAEIPTHDAGNK